MKRRVVVIGGGIGGASAALALAHADHDVVVIERGEALGGLVVSFEVAGTPLECFYHHIFPHEHHVIGLIDKLGLSSRLEWFPSSVGVYTNGTVWPFTSALDLLRFRPLPFVDRIRTGVGALRLGRVQEWKALDAVPADQWLASYTGERSVEVVWRPLLGAKFGPAAGQVPAAWMWGRFQQRAGARQRGGERLGYLRGGFRQMFDALSAELTRLGADIRTGSSVNKVLIDDGRARGIETDADTIEADAILFTGALPSIRHLVPHDLSDPRWGQIGGLGVVCVVIELTRKVGDVYWTNICDPAMPFGGVIEHTNLVPPTDYGGRHVVYVSRYFTHDEDIATTPAAEVAKDWIGALTDRYPGFAQDAILAVHPFKTLYAAPLVTLGHLGRIPPVATHIPGLFVSTTAQIYPQDRGMSEGVRTGIEAAGVIESSARLSRA